MNPNQEIVTESNSLIGIIGVIPFFVSLLTFITWIALIILRLKSRKRQTHPQSLRIFKWTTILLFLISFGILYLKSWSLGMLTPLWPTVLVLVAGFLGEFTPRENFKHKTRWPSGVPISCLLVINLLANLGFLYILVSTAVTENYSFFSFLPNLSLSTLILSSTFFVILFTLQLLRHRTPSLLRVTLFLVTLLLTIQTIIRPWLIERTINSL